MRVKWIQAINRIDNTSLVLIGFLLSFFIFYFQPVFLNTEQAMFQPTQLLDRQFPIGKDIVLISSFVKNWAEFGNPYASNNYNHTPLAFLFHLFIAWIGTRASYIAIVIINLLLVPVMLIIFPLLAQKFRRITPLIMLFAVTGFFSYGYQFELERGQINLITLSLCLWSIYLFHNYPRLNYLAYLLFSISVQLKLYPGIFVVFFIKDWRAWKQNIIRFCLIGLFNIALLFVLGIDIFKFFFSWYSCAPLF